MNEKLIEQIENSFLKDILLNNNVTDISYNGKDIYDKDNLKGRIKSDISITNDDAYSLIRQIANETEKLFSKTEPILDVTVGKYRINATHSGICRKNREEVLNFSIRIGYDSLRIKNDGTFIDKNALSILDMAIKNQQSIAISGKTGTGKTEFQKFLLSRFEENTRVIIIDTINELETDHFTKNLDSQTWIIPNQKDTISADELIKNALRSNPDWIIVGESRGKEMLSILNSAMSGHPTITTLHSLDGPSTYNRMARMCMISNESLDFEDVLVDIHDHFKFVVHIKSYFDEKKKKYVRYVDSLGTNDYGKYYEIYKYPKIYNPLPANLRHCFGMEEAEFKKFSNTFCGVKR